MLTIITALLIGDSHFFGEMGQHLMRKYDNSVMVSVVAAGSITYTRPRIWSKYPWAYRIWDGSRLTSIVSRNKGGGFVFPRSIDSILRVLRPSRIIIHLGNNQGDNHEKLLQLIRARTSVPIYWIGVFGVKSHRSINARIKRALRKFKNVFYIETSDIKQLWKKDTDDVHFSGPVTKIWAQTIYERIDQ